MKMNENVKDLLEMVKTVIACVLVITAILIVIPATIAGMLSDALTMIAKKLVGDELIEEVIDVEIIDEITTK